MRSSRDSTASPTKTALFEQVLLAEGGQLDDPVSFVRRLNGLLAMLPS